MASGTIHKVGLTAQSAISDFSALDKEWTAPSSGFVNVLFAASAGGAGEITFRDVTTSGNVARGYVAASKGTSIMFPAIKGHKYSISALVNSGTVIPFFYALI